MPTAPPSPCRHPGCHRVCHTRLCREHQRAYDRQRGSSSKRGYGRLWRLIRAAQLQREPWCRHCAEKDITEAATQVDHIVPRAQGGTDEEGNLQSLCASCHSRKTAREMREAGVWAGAV